MNDTLGPEEIVASVLVFGEYPPVHTKSEKKENRPHANIRTNIDHEAQMEIAQKMTEVHIKRALKHQVPTTADAVLIQVTKCFSGEKT